MTPIIDGLIQTYDSWELIRDQIYTILKTELTNQFDLATAAVLPNAEWYNIEVFRERSQPEQLWAAAEQGEELKGFVNVHFDNFNVDYTRSSMGGPFICDGRFMIDVVCASGAIGEEPADLRAVMKADLACKLVRNIMQAAEYSQLKLSPVVERTRLSELDRFQAESGSESNYKYSGNSFRIDVRFTEQGPQLDPKILDLVITETKNENDALLQAADF